MEASEILAALLDLAREAGLEVRPVGRSGLEAEEVPPGSAVCRVRGAIWVMLSSADPVAIQLEVLAEALRRHAPSLIEERHLPPAVRALLEGP
jgi:hypothetical protein